MTIKYKLLALDVDGTLVEGAAGVPTQRLIRALTAAKEKMQVILCTGRDEAEVRPIVEQLALADQWRILGGGSLIVSPQGERELEAGISAELAQRLHAAAVSLTERTVFQLTASGWRPFQQGVAPHMLSFPSRNHAHADQIESHLARFSPEILVTRVTDTEVPGQINVLCAQPGATKGTALTKLAARLGVRPEEILSFGDMPIDLPMFEVSGFAVAMGNAPEMVKARAHLVAPSVYDDGVAVVLEQLLG